MRNLKKVLALVLALVMAMSLMVTAGATSLSDYKDSGSVTAKYATAVDVATQLGILEGMGDSIYAPQGNLTRAQLATITYRIATGDVDKTYVNNFVGGASVFTDTPTNQWYAGYVGYAADAGYLKGMGDGTYAPNAALTGYQTLAALLRVIGYNEPGQFTGPDWTVQVAKVATETGILKGLTGVDLNGPITREETALLIYNALFAENVSYTLARGYQPNGKTLAEEIFKLDTPKDGVTANDKWGRPSTVWYDKDKEIVVSIAEEAVATHTVATSQCQIATDLGVKGTYKVDVYDNGVLTADKSFSATATTKNVGAQGTLIEVYQVGDTNTLVIIDTYLAKVTAVNEATYDKAGHLDEDATTELAVYYDSKTPDKMILEGDDYAEGDYILVNVNESDGKGKAVAEAKWTVEAVEVADTFVGAQSKILFSANKHVIDGTTYNDAVNFYLDPAGVTETENFIWFLDQYGNIIGNIAIDRTSYAVLKDIIWNVGKPGYAEATLVDFNGNESTVTVNTFDGLAGDWAANKWPDSYTKNGWSTAATDNNAEPRLSDASAAFPGVSTDTKYNDIYEGYALYEVYANDDGTVNLNGEPVFYDADAVVDTNSGVIWVDGNAAVKAVNDNNNNGKLFVTASTLFLVRNSDNTYSTYTRANVPDFEYNTEIFYTAENGVADLVYVKNGVVEAERGTHLFATTESHARYAGDLKTWEIDVVIDGAERTILTNKENIDLLTANVNKLFHVTWETDAYAGYYGFVDDLYLINDLEKDLNCNYLAAGIQLKDNTIIADGIAYVVDEDTVIIGADDFDSIKTTDGIWVVTDDNLTRHAAEVYVGEKLSESVAATVKIVDGDKSYDATYDPATKTYTVTLPEDVVPSTNAYYEITASGDPNARLNIDASKIDFLANARTIKAGLSNTEFTVYAENGLSVQKYFINYQLTDDTITGMITEITKQGDGVTQIATNQTGYKNFKAAVDNRVVLDVRQASVIHLTEDGSKVCPAAVGTLYPVKVVAFTDSADATLTNFGIRTAADAANTTSADGNVSVSALTAQNVVVVQYIQQGTGIPFYYAFQVTNNNP